MSAIDELFENRWERPAAFRVEEEALGAGGVMLTIHGEVDIATATEFRERLETAIEAGAGRLVLDLSPVTFIDSVAIATILQARTRLGAEGRLAVVLPSGSYTRLVFEIAGLPQCLDLFETREETIEHVGR
jgi:anti-sigma B factor antagonist